MAILEKVESSINQVELFRLASLGREMVSLRSLPQLSPKVLLVQSIARGSSAVFLLLSSSLLSLSS